MCRLTLEGENIVFKSLAVLAIAFLSLISKVFTEIISELSCGLLNQKLNRKPYALTLRTVV